MMMKRLTVYCILLIFLLPFCFPLFVAAEKVTIQLKNGRSIKTKSYFEKGDMVYFEQFGSQVGIRKNTVLKIVSNTKKNTDSKYSVVEYIGHLKPPVYYRVSGIKNTSYQKKWNYNGLYEQDGSMNGHPKYENLENGIWLYARCRKNGKRCVWALGRVPGTTSYVNIHAPDAKNPGAPGVWTSVTGTIMYPEIMVKKASPPDTVHLGKFTYSIQGLSLKDFNGLYKPKRIYNGAMRYVHVTNPYELYLQYGSWVISKCIKNCFRQYKSEKIFDFKLPHQVDSWSDPSGRSENCKVTIHNSTI